MKSFLFSFRFAGRNILRSPGRSIVIFLTLFLTMSMLTTIVGARESLRQIFHNVAAEKYLNVDAVMTYDTNSDARILNVRHLKEAFAESMGFTAVFFNYYGAIVIDGNTIGTEIFAATVEDLERVIASDLPEMQSDELFMTESFAKEQGVSVGEVIAVFVAGMEVNYRVSSIVPDRGVFTGSSVFLDKAVLLELLYGLSMLDNLGNTVYIDLLPSTTFDSFNASLVIDGTYSDYVVLPAIDDDKINLAVRNTVALLLGVGVITLVALVLIINSLFPLLYDDLRKEIGIIQILGGSNRFTISIWIWQFVLFALLAIPSGMWVTQQLFTLGAKVLRTITPMVFDWQSSLLAAGVFMLFLAFEVMYRYFRLKAVSAVSLSSDRRHAQVRPSTWVFVGAVILLILNEVVQPFSEAYRALVTVILGIMIAFSLVSVLLRWFGSFLGKSKHPSLLSLVGAKTLGDTMIIHNSLKVAVVSLVVIVLTMTVRSFMSTASDQFKAIIKVDYIFTNIVDYSDQLKNEIDSTYDIDTIDSAIVFQNVYMRFSPTDATWSRKANFVISMDPTMIQTYFDYDLSPALLEKLADSTTPYIVLPISVGKTFRIQEGDTIQIDLSRTMMNVSYIVAGFMTTTVDNLAFINTSQLTEVAGIGLENTLMINSSQGDLLESGLIRQYGSRMYQLINTQELLDSTIDDYLSLTDYLALLALAIALGFFLVIVNNSLLVFYALKADYAKIIVLGVSKKELTGYVLQEIAVMTLIVALASSIALSAFLPNLASLMLLLRYYRTMVDGWIPTAYRMSWGLLAFALSYAIHLFKTSRMNAVEEIKKY